MIDKHTQYMCVHTPSIFIYIFSSFFIILSLFFQIIFILIINERCISIFGTSIYIAKISMSLL